MTTSIFNNDELLNQVSSKFNVFIYQDTNYSDQSEKFYRFTVCKDRNSDEIGKVIFLDGNFKAGAQKVLGVYTRVQLLEDIADFMNA